MLRRHVHALLRVFRLLTAVLASLLVPAVVTPAAADTRHVLVLYSFEREFAPHNAFAGMFRTDLARLSEDPIEFIEVSLQSARSAGNVPGQAMVDRLRTTFAGRPLNLVVTIGGPAATFAQKYRSELFPAVPLLLAGVDRRFLEGVALTANDTAVTVQYDPAGMVAQILELLPETRTIVVIIGASQLERFWLEETKREFQRFERRVRFVWTSDLSYDEILQSCAALPANSAILFGVLSLDGKGEPQIDARTLGEVRAAAKAPVFGFDSTQLGQGIVGGPLLSIEKLSRNSVNVALRVLRGESPGTIRPPMQVPATPTFDWRELRRWKIDESRLPAGSIVQFREPALWDRYRGAMLTAGVFVTVQSLLLGVLVLELARQRRREQSSAVSEERFRLPSSMAAVKMWAAGRDGRCADGRRRLADVSEPSIRILNELGNGWTADVHPDDIERCLDIYSEAFNRREPFQMEYRVRRDGVAYRRVLDTGVPRFAGDRFSGYVGSTVDVAELTSSRTYVNITQLVGDTHEGSGRDRRDAFASVVVNR